MKKNIIILLSASLLFLGCSADSEPAKFESPEAASTPRSDSASNLKKPSAEEIEAKAKAHKEYRERAKKSSRRDVPADDPDREI